MPDREQIECGREEGEDGEKQEREKQGTTNERSNTLHHRWHEDGMKRALRHFEPWLVLSHAMSMHTIRRAKCMRKMTCEVYLSTHPVGCNGSPSTASETNCNKKIN